MRWFESVLLVVLSSVILLSTPFPATAEKIIQWDPQYIDFGIVPRDGTATQTLVLTNMGDEALTISGIEFTFNQMGAFGWTIPDAPDFPDKPVTLPEKDDTMRVVISFSPQDISFHMADLWIYSDADNAPSLYIGMLGMGDFSEPGPVDLSGIIKTPDGIDICAMVLASGRYMFSCNPPGIFSLSDLPREQNDTVKRQIYAHGFFPQIDVLTASTDETVVMTRSGTCPSYNAPYEPIIELGSAGKRIDIAGKVLLQNQETPLCAMVLANGQYMFTCDGTGSYALNIPLDPNGQFKLQVYADGFAPMIQRFDEFSPHNDVRMARAVECQ